MRGDKRFNTRHRNGVHLTLRCKDGSTVLVQSALTAISGESALLSEELASSPTSPKSSDIGRSATKRPSLTRPCSGTPPVCIIVADAHGKILQVNPAFESLTGFRQRELVGKSGWDAGLLDDDQRQASMTRFRELLGGATRTQSLLRVFTKKGGIRIIETHTTLTRSPSGVPQRFIITGMDVTEQKRLEAEVIKVAEQKNKCASATICTMVLARRYTGILSLSEALEGDLEGSARAELGRIRQLVSDAIQQVRELSHGITPGAVKHRSLGASLHLMLEGLRSSRLHCECHCDFEPDFKSPDAATQLFRIAQEAVANAIKHGRPEKIAVYLRRSSGNRGLMEIHDDGTGISGTQVGSVRGHWNPRYALPNWAFGRLVQSYQSARRRHGGNLPFLLCPLESLLVS